MTQYRAASESVVVTPRSGGGNWERKNTMRVTYHFLFEDEGAFV